MINKAQLNFLTVLQPDAAPLEREGGCDKTLALARYAAGLLTGKDNKRMVEHLAYCRHCRRTMAEHVKNQRRIRVQPPRSSRPDDEAVDMAYAARKDRP